MPHPVEPQELEPLLDFYRLRYHHQTQNAAYCDREIKLLGQDITELKQQLQAAGAREKKLQAEIADLKKQKTV